MKGKAYFIVRAQVNPDDRAAFERWYAEEHLPDAVKAFGAAKGWRGWSRADPSIHMAFYEFETLAQVEAIQGSDKLKDLVAEFDRVWGTRVTRTREIIEIAQAI